MKLSKLIFILASLFCSIVHAGFKIEQTSPDTITVTLLSPLTEDEIHSLYPHKLSGLQSGSINIYLVGYELNEKDYKALRFVSLGAIIFNSINFPKNVTNVTVHSNIPDTIYSSQNFETFLYEKLVDSEEEFIKKQTFAYDSMEQIQKDNDKEIKHIYGTNLSGRDLDSTYK